MTNKTAELKQLIRTAYEKQNLVTDPDFVQLDSAIDECLESGGIVNFKINGRGQPEVNLTYREGKHLSG